MHLMRTGIQYITDLEFIISESDNDNKNIIQAVQYQFAFQFE